MLGDTINGSDVFVGDLTTTDVKLVPLAAGPGRQGSPLISPDERWLAYGSDESGRMEVFLRPLRGDGPRTRISVDGGSISTGLWVAGASCITMALSTSRPHWTSAEQHLS